MNKLKNISKFIFSLLVLTLMICLHSNQTYASLTKKEPTGYWKLEAADYGKDLSQSSLCLFKCVWN